MPLGMRQWERRKRWARPTSDAHSTSAMTPAERVQAFWQLYEQLDALTQPDEIKTYPFLEHLEDLINDLSIDCEQ